MRSLPALDISKMVPTAEQLAQARADLVKLTPQQKLAKEASLRAYLKKNPIEDKIARGDTRARINLLDKFQVILNDSKGAQSTQSNDREISSGHELIKTLKWYGEELLLEKVCKIKGQHWLDSQLLPVRPDSVTGSNDRYHVEYGKVKDIEKYTEADLRRLKQRVENELEKKDIEALDKLMTSSSNNGLLMKPNDATAASTGDAAVEKSPEVKAEETMARAMESLRANVHGHIKKFQDQSLTDTLIKAKCDAFIKSSTKPKEKKRAQDLITDLAGQTKKITKIQKLLTRMLSEETADTELPSLIKYMNEIDEEIADNMAWAHKIDCHVNPESPSSKKRKRKSTDE